MILSFSLGHSETSKDSNSETIKIEISTEKLVLKKQYSGFKAPEDVLFEKKLNNDKLSLIQEFIKKHQLNINLKEVKETDNIGIAGFLRIEIFQPDTSYLLIEGKTNIWGSDDYIEKNWGKEFVKSKTNIENIEYFNKAKNFVRFLENL